MQLKLDTTFVNFLMNDTISNVENVIEDFLAAHKIYY